MKILKKLLLLIGALAVLLGGFLGYKYLTLADLIGSEPSFGTSSDQLVFTSEISGVSQIYSVNIVSGVVDQITYTESEKHYPVVSPDGKRMVFNEKISGNWKLIVLELETKETRELVTLKTFNPMRASWSYDSKMIVYPNTSGNVRDIYTYDLVNGKEELLVASEGDKSFPVLLSDNTSIAYVEVMDVGRELLLFDLESKITRRLTENDHYDSHLSLSEDGLSLVYRSRQNGSDWIKTYELVSEREKSVREFKDKMYYPIKRNDGQYLFALERDGEINVYIWSEEADLVTKISSITN